MTLDPESLRAELGAGPLCFPVTHARENFGFADEPYRPAPYDSRPAKRGRGWYAGDMHVHAEHSAYGDATMREALDFWE